MVNQDEPELGELCEKILVHIYRYGPDSPKYMAHRLLGASGWAPTYDEKEIKEKCKKMESLRLIRVFQGPLKRSPTSSVKPWIKIKAREINYKPAGIYYELTKDGKRIAGKLFKEKYR
ncbi:TVG1001389 [Thermoplasma volcanium GSS1]|uniref:TVG1001389 protein n=1 Tax=Thermoplasma volcanium (strain ATCC 51530 / DSM 4299 / JCM 9571 / NBRC 15438 / GSS1) TaxID=273116 RepID=Q97A30_THEVO|nr:hypothetical protein [Thermoplasma volcanium]BAB60122.1 TVG1001389 [Thermoplasma volcanium GSS1]